MNIIKKTFINFFILTILMNPITTKSQSLQTVPSVNLKKYSGKWYEIARLPNSFEKKLDLITATYTVRKDGKIEVINKGYLIGDHSKSREAKGVAWIPDSNSPAKLKVRFFWPFSGKYWIIELDNDYQYAMVGHPSRNYFWILSRNKNMDEDTYKKLLDNAAKKGFDVNKIIRVNQIL